MKSRDYLVSIGLVKKGSRGRISKDAKAALNKALADGMTFSDITAGENNVAVKTPKQAIAVEIKPRTKTREQTVVYGIDAGNGKGHEDVVIGFSICHGCGKPIQYCTHDVPKLPAWLDSETYMEHP